MVLKRFRKNGKEGKKETRRDEERKVALIWEGETKIIGLEHREKKTKKRKKERERFGGLKLGGCDG